MIIYSLTSQAGGSQEHLLEMKESAPDFCRDSFAVTTQVSIAAMWQQASPVYIYIYIYIYILKTIKLL